MDEAAQQTTSFRPDPELKEALKKAAARRNRSLSAEMIARLERSIADEALGADLSSPIVRMVAAALKQAETTSGKPWYLDQATQNAFHRSLVGIAELMVPLGADAGGRTINKLIEPGPYENEIAVFDVAARTTFFDDDSPESDAVLLRLASHSDKRKAKLDIIARQVQRLKKQERALKKELFDTEQNDK